MEVNKLKMEFKLTFVYVRKVSLIGNEEGIESRWKDNLQNVLSHSFGQEADIQR